MSAPVAASLTVDGSTRVRLHPLHMRDEGGSWIVGRVETGEFVALPPVGQRAVALLADHTVEQVRRRLRAEAGSDVDVAAFVTSLVELGFVAALDDRPLPQAPVPAPMFPRLRPRHVRWLLHPAPALAVGALLIAALVAVAVDPALAPDPGRLVWSDSGAAVLLGNFVIVWSLILLHELAHLFTARAAGAPGRMSLGTRLQFLVAQTDVSGVWAAPRRARLTVYLAGIAVNLVVSAVAVLLPAATHLVGVAGDLVAAVGLLSLTLVPVQFLVFMRTDVYFMLQDLAGCANLYADGSAYARHLARRLVRVGGPEPDPSERLTPRERLAVRVYTVVLVLGTAGCLAVAALVTLPVSVELSTTAARTVLVGGSTAEVLDAAAFAGISALCLALWTWAWWRRHGPRIRRKISRTRRRGGRR
ncbi:hypothetical protein [Micromonospora mirobrigensis]|uniref:Peptidase family M50 n=1 Tax=Micromonospora mirobrigensis TaxID=262898 RepID=A0A1C4YLQ7_9ACTN|nr:hypothetical protein [Micromonospora mirobrigensis]SCF21598.1 Peptidase family M50 [Micromonospora mirobrigensis]